MMRMLKTNAMLLKKYTLDLTQRARDGKLDPVIGRDDETAVRFKYCNAVPKTTLC